MKRLLFIVLALCSTPIMAMQQPQTNYDKFINAIGLGGSIKKAPEQKKNNDPFYDPFIDGLQVRNKTVRDFVKEKHTQKHNEAIKGIQKEWQLTDKQVNNVEEFVQLTKARDRYRNKPFIKHNESNDESINQLYTATKELYKKFNIKTPLVIRHDKSEATHNFQKIVPGLGAINVFNIGFDIADCEGCGSMGTLAHELTHLKKYHSTELKEFIKILPNHVHADTSPAWRALIHRYEYEGDQLYATTNVFNAYIMERMTKACVSRQRYPWRDSTSHPASTLRYKAVKEIRKMMEAQYRWYAGPKGYKKYGEPAFESMWDRQCEHNKRINNFTSLLGAI